MYKQNHQETNESKDNFLRIPFDLDNYIIEFTSAQFCEPLFTERHQVAQKAKYLPTLAKPPVQHPCFSSSRLLPTSLPRTGRTLPNMTIKSTVIFYYSAPFSCLFLICCLFCSFSTLLAVLARAAFFLLLYSFHLFCLLDLVMTF